MRLTAEQSQAATIGVGPVRVVAGAGTGKTSVIAERFARLVKAGVAPESILVMTFTDRAAREMRARIEERIGGFAPAVGTFHSIALGWLRSHGAANFRIIAGAERWILARELMWQLGDPALTEDERPDDHVRLLLQLMERLKQELVPPERLAAWASEAEDRERADLMRACVRFIRAYESACRSRHLTDFDGILVGAVRMLEQRPRVREEYQRRYPAVLVDEYQDLNLVQERLVELVADPEGEVCIVGDDDQSIYRFRGASRASLARFVKSFSAARTVTLERNHRSSKRILAAASALISNNAERLPKQLKSSNPAGAAVEVWGCEDAIDEAEAIAAEAAALQASGHPLGEIAVLCRTNAIARPVAAALAARDLPHVVFGGHGFFDRAEVRDVIALMRVIDDPDDVIALARVLTRPPADLDGEQALRMLADRGERPALDAAREWDGSRPIALLLLELVELKRTADVRDLFFELMNRTAYLQVVAQRLEASEAARAAANISHLAELVAQFCDAYADHSLGAYMRYLELVLLSGEDEESAPVEGIGDAISVMTIHQAKGLEFDTIFVPSLVEGRLPQSGRYERFQLPPSILEPLVRGREDVIAEERRLLYVAMTRARHRLYLTRASHYEGGRRWRDSRFIVEVLAAPSRSVIQRKPAARPREAPIEISAAGEAALSLSFSAIDSYRECPRQYWYRYVQKLPAKQSAEAVHGVIVHEVLQQIGLATQRGEQISMALVRRLHDEAWGRSRFPDARREPTFRKLGLEQLRRYIEGGGFATKPTHLERDFVTDVDGWTLRGVIDRIDKVEDGWTIVDYKSGRKSSRSRRDLQVALYALGAKSALGLEPLSLEVVYLASAETVKVDVTDSLVDEARRAGGEVAAGVRGGRFEARPSWKCRLCPYRLACAEAL